MPTPEEQAVADEFLERAQEIHPDFQLVSSNGDSIMVVRGQRTVSVGLYLYATVPADASRSTIRQAIAKLRQRLTNPTT